MQNPDYKDILPRICYAVKAKIEDIMSKEWMDLVKLDSNLEEGGKDFTDDFTKVRTNSDKTPWYMSFTKITESIDEYNLTEESFL